jgi:hypothetical protein
LKFSKIQGWKPTFEYGDPPLKNKPIEVRSHEIQVENNPWNFKKKRQYMDKPNGKHLKLFEIKMAWWLAPFPSPKEMIVQSP